MVNRSFQFPLGIGTDICKISRIYNILASKQGPKFVNKLLTEQERQQPRSQQILNDAFSVMHDQMKSLDQPFVFRFTRSEQERFIPALQKAAEFIAGRFAAKEAAIKAHTSRKLSFHSIEIRRQALAEPESTMADLRGEDGAASEPQTSEQQLSSGPPIAVIRGRKDGDKDQVALLSISHDGDYATAVCLAYLGENAS
ncbi:uncharacterized protein BCR38DRAFT_431693 [Pseudomassariella vexata]|uniref:4'-phosphopantetheinyl transferase domain-containing protein n=1 Tax=Pseudomassariella vexata TaxID=1141098 RepID=A0A1Y2E123_9PEZI|nr:uncharacterized protein BCR38DRAFT_431693 [Pseudomassariella vexata]ORY65036.1 hypothetical protein BCR38DRAFT_431693 [Pseudomassariella vexata]